MSSRRSCFISFTWMICLYSTLLLSPTAHAWTPDVIQAFQAVADGVATPQQQALAFAHNNDLQMMREQKHIKQNVYEKVQNRFVEQASELIRKATNDAGMSSRLQRTDPNKPARPKSGADVDGHAIRHPEKPEQQVTAQDLKNAREAFNGRVNEYLRANNVAPLDNAARRLTVDIMPADGSSPSGKPFITNREFAKTADYINSDGGTMYRDPIAAKVEAYRRGADVGTPSLVEWARYVSEQQRQIMGHDHTRHLTEEIGRLSGAERGSPEWIQRQNERGMVQLEAEQTGKYLDRIARSANEVGEGFGLSAHIDRSAGNEAAHRVTDNRGPGMALEAGKVDAFRENTTSADTRSFVEVVARIAEIDPTKRAEANAAIAEATRNLSAAERSEILARVSNDPTLGGQAASNQLAEAMQANAVPDEAHVLKSSITAREMAADGIGSGETVTARNDANSPGESLAGEGGYGSRLAGGIRSADQAVGAALGVGELDAEASAARAAGNKALGGAATALGVGMAAWEVGKNVGNYVEGMDRAFDDNATDEQKIQASDQARQAAENVALVGAVGTAIELSPVVAGGSAVGYGAYQGTRQVLENTESGRRIDAAVLNGIDNRNIANENTPEAQQIAEAEIQARIEAYRSAIQRGEISIKPPHTWDELVAVLRHPESNTYLAGVSALVDNPAERAAIANANQQRIDQLRRDLQNIIGQQSEANKVIQQMNEKEVALKQQLPMYQYDQTATADLNSRIQQVVTIRNGAAQELSRLNGEVQRITNEIAQLETPTPGQ